MSSPFYLAGLWERSNEPLPVTCPFDNSEVGATWLAGDAEFERATVAAVAAAETMRRLPVYERAEILMRAHAELVARREEIGRVIAGEVGKALRDALAEADRGAQTFQAAAEEARRLGGEVIPMDFAPHGVGRLAFTRRYPIGPVAGISPFNFPFNLTAHKIAPAVAAGCPIRAQAGQEDAAVGVDPGRGPRPRPPAEGRAERAADVAGGGRPPRHRRSLQTADLHRITRRSAGR